MAEPGYKSLLSYNLAQIAFDLGWEFVPLYYTKYEDGRQRDQIKQALRSLKQNIVEGSSERSLSSKLKLYDVAKASGMEAREDFEDILRRLGLSRWSKDDPRLAKLRHIFESSPSPSLSFPSISLWVREQMKVKGKDGLEGLEEIANYELDMLIRCGYLLDQQIRAVEKKHTEEGGYRENLLKKRLEYRRSY
ncbi:MAG: four helix bundle protein [Patescibacteria group bacterium]